MNYLIDTHVLIWFVTGNLKLARKFIEEIQNPDNTVLVAKVSLWEIAIKVSLEKLTLGISLRELENYLTERNFAALEFNHEDLQQLIQLPFHHRDPFDRLIISQAIKRNITVITDDKKFELYPVQLL